MNSQLEQNLTQVEQIKSQLEQIFMSLLQLEWGNLTDTKLRNLENRRFLHFTNGSKKPSGANSPRRGVFAPLGFMGTTHKTFI
jgi:hypothetical protein